MVIIVNACTKQSQILFTKVIFCISQCQVQVISLERKIGDTKNFYVEGI